MSGANPLSPPNFPRLFWPVSLSLAALVAAALFVTPLINMRAHGSMNYNEGWNAYHQREAVQGKPLYGAPPLLLCNNYPPISFHLVGLASQLTGGDVNQTGRWIALLSLGLVALLTGMVVLQFTGSAPLAAYAALSVLISLTVFKEDRVGMNDPQLLGMVFGVLGLYAYVRNPQKPAWLSISAAAFTISVFTKHNLLAFPAAVGLHLLLGKKWKGLAVWCGVVAGGSLLTLVLTRWIDGPYFLANILVPRLHYPGLKPVTAYAMLFQFPIAFAVLWSSRNIGRSPAHIMVLALILTHALAVTFAGGDGVDSNIFFDCVISLAVVNALVFAEFAPLLARWKWPGFPLAGLLVALTFGVLIQVPQNLRTDWFEVGGIRRRAKDFDFSLNLLRSRPGPALCEDLLLCYEAGKPFIFDPYFTKSMTKVGHLKEQDLIELVQSGRFRTVQLNGTDLAPEEREHFTAKFMEALLNYYRLENRLDHSLILFPKK
jgi:hypothetical protein